MPNHTDNLIEVRGDNAELKKFYNKYFTNGEFDFNKVIPEPETEAECEERFKYSFDSHIKQCDDRPWFDWYKFHNAKWGTKWNAYNQNPLAEKDIEGNKLTIFFNTAWCPPIPIYEKLVEDNAELDITCYYLGEGYEFAGCYDIDGDIDFEDDVEKFAEEVFGYEPYED